MDFRLAIKEDSGDILSIIQQAQAYFRSIKNPQWQNGYPNLAVIQQDIQNCNAYVLSENGQIIATSALVFACEPTYDHIYQGQWLHDEPYAVIHRIAIAGTHKGNGTASQLLSHLENQCTQQNVLNIRVDTHRHNLSMQRFLQKNGFIQCGIIYLADHSERLAYEKHLHIT